LDSKENFFLTDEAAEWIGLKKSELLSELINQLTGDDFGFEEFHKFDHLITQTIEFPDRIFADTSEDFEQRTYIRTYKQDIQIHQLVIGAIVKDQTKNDVFVPVLCFVTKKEDLALKWSKGKLLSKQVLN
jgi:hypothetical protein